jgi:hypothetical protein
MLKNFLLSYVKRRCPMANFNSPMIRGTKGGGILKLRFNFLRCGRDEALGSICLLRISRPRRS